jgi:hypothetical protein
MALGLEQSHAHRSSGNSSSASANVKQQNEAAMVLAAAVVLLVVVAMAEVIEILAWRGNNREVIWRGRGCGDPFAGRS